MTQFYRGKVIYCDVDNTLIDHLDIPKTHVLEYLKAAKESGCKLYLWSQGGRDYCKRIAEDLNIADWFIGFLDKPEECIDDLSITADFILRRIHPMELLGQNWVKNEE